MALRGQILKFPEILSDLAWAAEQRFREAEELLTAARFTGAVYLLGLGAEMWLKLSCFRFTGARPSDAVNGLLAPARTWMNAHAPAIPHESYHSLLFWAEYLLRRRAAGGMALSASVAGQLRHHVMNRLFLDWKIEIRYRSVAVSESDAWRVYNDVAWLRQAWQMLWR